MKVRIPIDSYEKESMISIFVRAGTPGLSLAASILVPAIFQENVLQYLKKISAKVDGLSDLNYK